GLHLQTVFARRFSFSKQRGVFLAQHEHARRQSKQKLDAVRSRHPFRIGNVFNLNCEFRWTRLACGDRDRELGQVAYEHECKTDYKLSMFHALSSPSKKVVDD